MGDTGSLALGRALAGMAVLSRTELLLLLLGGLLVIVTVLQYRPDEDHPHQTVEEEMRGAEQRRASGEIGQSAPAGAWRRSRAGPRRSRTASGTDRAGRSGEG